METTATKTTAGNAAASTTKAIAATTGPNISEARKSSRIIAAGLAALMLSTSLTMLPADLNPADVLSAEPAYAAQLATGTIKAETGKATVKAAAAESYLNYANGTYEFSSYYSGKYIDVPGASTGNNVAVKTYTNNSTLAQRFYVNRESGDVYTLQAGCSGKYLTDRSGTVVQQSKSSSSYQRWRFVKSGSYVLLKNVGTGRYVTVGSTGNSASLITRAKTGNSNQLFRMSSSQLIKSGYYVLKSSTGGRYLDLSAASTANNANVQIWSGNGTNAQKWYFRHMGSNYYRIENAASGKALDLRYNSTANGVNVVQYSCASWSTQLWHAEVSNNGGIVFVNKYSGKALDVSQAQNRDGQNVHIWSCNSNGPAQRWILSKTTVAPVNGFVNVDECYSTLNTYRSWYGRGGMVRDTALENYARVRAQELVSNCSHTRPNGERGLTGIQRIKPNVCVAENIAAGQKTCSEAMTWWYNSPNHLDHMVDSRLHRAGIAGYRYNGTIYWVQVFSG